MQGSMAPIVLLVASINATVNFMIPTVLLDKMCVLLSSTVLLDNYSQLILVVLIVLTR